MNALTETAKPVAALSGIRVVDLTQFEAGTTCTETLAWLGADVVKIEPPAGEISRFASSREEDVDSHYFIVMNANKRSMKCDLKAEGGKEVLRKLIAKADVMIENMAPGAIERLGFGYDVVREINPRIIYAQIKGFAADGPYANFLTFDGIAQSMGGAVALTGAKDGPPMRPSPHVGDTGAGLHCAIGILAALQQRHLTGCGQRIEVAMQEAVINFSRAAFGVNLKDGKPKGRAGNRTLTGSTLSDIYRCKPGGPNDYVLVYPSQSGSKNKDKLFKVIGREDLADDPRYSTPEAKDALVAAWCLERTKVEAMEALQRGGVPAGAVLDTRDLSEDAHLRKRGMFATVEHPVRGSLTIPAFPVKMSNCNVPVRCSPLLGEHTDEVLSEWLGMNREAIDALHTRGVG